MQYKGMLQTIDTAKGKEKPVVYKEWKKGSTIYTHEITSQMTLYSKIAFTLSKIILFIFNPIFLVFYNFDKISR